MGSMHAFPSWSIAAVNLPEHADNPVHTVEGGLAAGYDGAVVAGTTVFAYLTRPVAAAWGRDWVTNGGHEVWFRAPVLADEIVTVSGDPDEVTATVGSRRCALTRLITLRTPNQTAISGNINNPMKTSERTPAMIDARKPYQNVRIR